MAQTALASHVNQTGSDSTGQSRQSDWLRQHWPVRLAQTVLASHVNQTGSDSTTGQCQSHKHRQHLASHVSQTGLDSTGQSHWLRQHWPVMSVTLAQTA